MGEDKEGQEKPVNTESYRAAATAVADGAAKKLSPKKQETHQRLTLRQKIKLAAITLTFLAATGCNLLKPPTTTLPIPTATPIVRSEALPNPTVTVIPTNKAEPTPIPPTPTATPLPEKQKYQDQLPADIVPEEELEEKYHTKIWNIPDTKLHLRRAALEEEPIFKYLQESGTHFDIVLLNGYKVHPAFFSKEQKENLPHLLKQLYKEGYKTPEEMKAFYLKFKEPMIQRHNQDLDELKKKFGSGLISQDKFNVEKQILDERLRPFVEEPTEEDYADIDRGWPAGGMYISPTLEKVDVHDKEGKLDWKLISRMYILLPVGSPRDKVFHSGTEAVITTTGGRGKLTPAQSFPNPGNYTIRKDQPDYPVSSNTTGWLTRHEFAHFEKGHPQTDFKALGKLEEAYKAYLQGDDSLYYFVFETPQGNVVTKQLAEAESKAA